MSTEFEFRADVEFAIRGTEKLKGNLWLPKGQGKTPVVIGVHGGGWHTRLQENYQYWGPWLAARGYAVFAPTYRLSSAEAKSFPECFHDVRAAVQWIKGNAASLGLDAERIALMGDSAGGHLVSLVALAGDDARFKDGNAGDAHGALSTRVKAVIPIYGVLDLMAQWRHDLTARTRDPITEKLLGVSAIDDKRAYFDASPLSYVSGRDNSTAFLVVWGTHDDIVDCATQSEAFLEALKQAKFYARPVVVHGAPHFWSAEPIEEAGSHSGFLAPRLLRFLQAKL
ncbi:MAG: alpha/beta hydrolase fold domain-containing protein [Burkholderiales bacterium]